MWNKAADGKACGRVKGGHKDGEELLPTCWIQLAKKNLKAQQEPSTGPGPLSSPKSFAPTRSRAPLCREAGCRARL